MSERFSAWIEIGGQIARSNAEQLLGKLQSCNASLDWGEPMFEPTSIDALVDAKTNDTLRLCNHDMVSFQNWRVYAESWGWLTCDAPRLGAVTTQNSSTGDPQ